jgi:hypothetical protein
MPIPLSSMMAAGQPAPLPDQNRASALIPQGQPQSQDPIEQEYFDNLNNNYLKLRQDYAAIKDSDGGKILSTDIARELSPHYLADRTKSANVHEPSSQFIKRVYAEKLSNPTPKGSDSTVVFTAGGTGAGKTSALRALQNVSELVKRAEMVYDTNMNKFESSDKKIQQALRSNRKVSIIYTYRDPVEALENGALKRANGQEKEFGTGRTVPIGEHLKTHIGALNTIHELQEKYKNNPKVEIKILDNSRGIGKTAVSSLDKLPKLNENQVERKLYDTLERARRSGDISENTYRGFAAKPR